MTIVSICIYDMIVCKDNMQETVGICSVIYISKAILYVQIKRTYKLYQAAASDLLGDAVFFYGDQCMHWISPVVSGRRTILQMASWH